VRTPKRDFGGSSVLVTSARWINSVGGSLSSRTSRHSNAINSKQRLPVSATSFDHRAVLGRDRGDRRLQMAPTEDEQHALHGSSATEKAHGRPHGPFHTPNRRKVRESLDTARHPPR
jgi:hypothetical protein